MKLADLQVEIRPRTPEQTAALATRLLQHRPGPILTAAALVALPTAALAPTLLLCLELPPGLVWPLVIFFAPLFTPPLYATAGLLVFSPQVTFRQVAVATMRRMLPFAALFVLTRLALLLGTALLVIPGLFLWRNSWFLGPIVVLEGTGLRAAWRRGNRLALGYYVQVLSHAMHAGGLLIYLSLAFAALLHFLLLKVFGLTFPQPAAWAEHDAYWHLIGLSGFSLALPLVALMWFFVYLDVRIRKEGWDLEIAFRAQATQLEGSRG